MWAAGDEPVFKDIIKFGYIHGVTHCHFLPCALATKVKTTKIPMIFGRFLGYLTTLS
jgi:hypothetical protein